MTELVFWVAECRHCGEELVDVTRKALGPRTDDHLFDVHPKIWKANLVRAIEKLRRTP